MTPWHVGIPDAHRRFITLLPPGAEIERDWFLRSIPDFDLWFIVEGKASIRLPDGQEVALHRGSALLLKPGMDLSFHVDPETPLHTAWIHFDLLDPSSGQPMAYDRVELPGFLAGIIQLPYFETTFRHLISLYDDTPPEVETQESRGRREQSGHLLMALLWEFASAARRQEAHSPPGDPTEQLHQQVATSFLSWLQLHSEQRVTAGEMARRFGYSLPHFSRIVRKVLGKTPSAAIIEARIDRAKSLLSMEESTLNIGEIAESLGYENIFYFSRQFKQLTGLSPQEYRRATYARQPGGHLPL